MACAEEEDASQDGPGGFGKRARGSGTFLSLRASTLGNTTLDKSLNYTAAPTFHEALAWQSMRFLNNDLHYSPFQADALLASLNRTPERERRRFFEVRFTSLSRSQPLCSWRPG